MRHAIYSDIHANLPAWEAVLADMAAVDAQVRVCLGDVVGYGPSPKAVLQSVRQHSDHFVLGNHDAAAAGTLDLSIFNPVARSSVEWTRERLGDDDLSFLAERPLAIEGGDLLFVHAEVEDPARFQYIDSPELAQRNFNACDHRIVFVGHTHRAALFRKELDGSVTQLPDHDCVLQPDHRYLVNVGSVGEPRSLHDVSARYAVYDSETGRLFFRRVEFDVEAFRRDMVASELEVTPFFLTVVDQQEADGEERTVPDNPEIHASEMVGDPAHYRALAIQPDSTEEAVEAEGEKEECRRRPRRRSGWKVALVVLPVLMSLTAAVIFLAARKEGATLPWFGNQSSVSPTEAAPAADVSAAEPTEPSNPLEPAPVFGPPLAARPDLPEGLDLSPPKPENASAPAAAEPSADGAPESEPAPPAEEPLPPPSIEEVPRLDDLPFVTSLHQELYFYAPFDEAGRVREAQDIAPGGGSFPISAGRLGDPGVVRRAVRLTGEAPLRTASKSWPADVQALTVAFWIRVLESSEEDPSPGGVLVGLHGMGSVKMESGLLVADLDGQGARARLEFPKDERWHHVVATHSEGSTKLWLDGGVHARPVAETLPVPPAEPGPVSLGGGSLQWVLDDVAIWTRELTRDERQIIFRRGQDGVPVLAAPRTLAHWTFDDDKGDRLLRDSAGNNFLGAFRPWAPAEPIAPDPIPLTGRANPSAARILHVEEAPEKEGSFRLKADVPFTFEGWVKFSGGAGGTLGGTIHDDLEENSRPGWRVAARRDGGANGYLAFMYERQGEKVQALAREVPIFDGFAHHFAAVWDPWQATGNGKMKLYLDNAVVAEASLPLSGIGRGKGDPFQIVASRTPIQFDELRFTSATLTPDEFLTAGRQLDRSETPERSESEETAMQRSERERRERLAEEQAERERRRAEEEAKRNREKLGID